MPLFSKKEFHNSRSYNMPGISESKSDMLVNFHRFTVGYLPEHRRDFIRIIPCVQGLSWFLACS